jgi:hypothetical protein
LRPIETGRTQIHAQLSQSRSRQTTTGASAFVKNDYLCLKAVQPFRNQCTGKSRTYYCYPFSLLHRLMPPDHLQNFSYYAILLR